MKLIFQWIPTLCFQLKFLSVSGNEELAQIFFGDVANLPYTLHRLNLLVVTDRYGKEKFIIFATIQSSGGKVHIEFFCLHGCLVVDRYVLLIYSASAMTLFADMH